MLLNWRDHSWLHLFRRDKVVCSNITMSVEGRRRRRRLRRRRRGERGMKESGMRGGKGRNNDKRTAA